MPAGFFVDETDLALGKALATRHDVVYPGHPGLPEVPRGTLDDAWLPVIGAKRLLVVTRDRRIRYRPVEKRPDAGHGPDGCDAGAADGDGPSAAGARLPPVLRQPYPSSALAMTTRCTWLVPS